MSKCPKAAQKLTRTQRLCCGDGDGAGAVAGAGSWFYDWAKIKAKHFQLNLCVCYVSSPTWRPAQAGLYARREPGSSHRNCQLLIVVVVPVVVAAFLLISSRLGVVGWLHKLQFIDKQIARKRLCLHTRIHGQLSCLSVCVFLPIKFYDQFVFCVETIYLAKRN